MDCDELTVALLRTRLYQDTIGAEEGRDAVEQCSAIHRRRHPEKRVVPDVRVIVDARHDGRGDIELLVKVRRKLIV